MRPLLTALCLMSTPLAAQEAPRVVADIAPIRSLVAQVMEGVGNPSLIIPTSASPHSYAMRPSEARALRNADLVVWVGPGLTHWLEEPLDTLSGSAARLTLMELPKTRGLELRPAGVLGVHAMHGDEHHDEHDHEKHHDEDAGHEEGHEHEEGHAHGEGHDHEAAHGHEHHGIVDPHGWLSPDNAVHWAGVVAQTLAQIDPDNAQTYMYNWTALSEEVAAAVQDINTQLAPLQDTPFIVLHDGTQYFEASFGLQAEAFVVPGDGRTPGPASLKALRDELAEHPVACAFTSPQENTSLLRTVTEGQDTRLAELDPMGDGEEHYAVMLRRFADDLATCLTAR